MSFAFAFLVVIPAGDLLLCVRAHRAALRPRSIKPFAAGVVKLMPIEPKAMVNTVDAGGEMTAGNDVWV